VVSDWDIINMISSVDVAHSYNEFTLDNSVLFYKENSSSLIGSKNEPQNSSYVCRGMTQQGQKKEGRKERKKERKKDRKKESNKQMKEGRKKERKKHRNNQTNK